MKNDEIIGKINDKELVLQLLKFPTIPLLLITDDTQKIFEFNQKAVKINGMAIAWDVFDVCDKKLILDALKQPKGFRFFSCIRKNDDEIASRTIHLYPENISYTDYKCYNLRNRVVRKN